MANFKPVIINNKQYKRSDGTYNIKIRLSHKGKTRYISTEYNVLPNQINNSTGNIISHPNAAHINIRLKGMVLSYERILFPFTDRLHNFDAKDIITLIQNTTGGQVDFYLYANRIIQELEEGLRQKSADAYSMAIRQLKLYSPKNGLSFDEITFTFLKGFELYMRGKKLSVSTIGIYLRSIRAIYNRAILDDLVQLNLYPFRKYSIPKGANTNRNLDLIDIKKLQALKLDKDQEIARDTFLLIFFLIGINFKDLFKLKQVTKARRIFYSRSKTSKSYSVLVQKEAIELIEKYRGENSLLFFADKYKSHEVALRRINELLVDIGKEHLKFKFNLTTYYARHSWATNAIRIGITKDVVSLALGHSYGNAITDAYIEYDMKAVDSANRQLLDALNSCELPQNDINAVDVN